MKILFVLTLSLYALSGTANNLLPLHSKRNVWRNFVQEKLPQHVRHILVGATTIATLLLASPAAAQDEGGLDPLDVIWPWEKAELREHLNVLHLVLDVDGVPRRSVLV